MPLKTGKLDEPSINMTPMIDVVFLLIIFFMVGARIGEEERNLDVQLPQAAVAQPMIAKPDALVVNVFEDGRILLGKLPLNLEGLEKELVAARTRYPDQAVVIRGEGEGKYQAVVDVLVACHRAKIKQYSLATVVKGK